jgi:hypothetical protein
MVDLVKLAESAKKVIRGGREYLSTKEGQREALRVLEEMCPMVYPGSTVQGDFGTIRELYQQATGKRVHKEILA